MKQKKEFQPNKSVIVKDAKIDNNGGLVINSRYSIPNQKMSITSTNRWFNISD